MLDSEILRKQDATSRDRRHILYTHTHTTEGIRCQRRSICRAGLLTGATTAFRERQTDVKSRFPVSIEKIRSS